MSKTKEERNVHSANPKNHKKHRLYFSYFRKLIAINDNANTDLLRILTFLRIGVAFLAIPRIRFLGRLTQVT